MRSALAMLVGLTAFACLGPRISGFVVDDVVAGARVEITELDSEGAFVSLVGSATTGADGFFRRRVPGQRVYRLVATGGQFTDEATGCPVDLASRGGSLEAIVGGPGRFAVTPLTSMAAELTRRELASGLTASEAMPRRRSSSPTCSRAEGSASTRSGRSRRTRPGSRAIPRRRSSTGRSWPGSASAPRTVTSWRRSSRPARSPRSS
jgi:hypothetical protein